MNKTKLLEYYDNLARQLEINIEQAKCYYPPDEKGEQYYKGRLAQVKKIIEDIKSGVFDE